MYEKPQYLTPDGFQRSSKNPLTGGKNKSVLTELQEKKKLLLEKQQPRKPKLVLSDEAAKAIADAIKGMLMNK